MFEAPRARMLDENICGRSSSDVSVLSGCVSIGSARTLKHLRSGCAKTVRAREIAQCLRLPGPGGCTTKIRARPLSDAAVLMGLWVYEEFEDLRRCVAAMSENVPGPELAQRLNCSM